MLSNRYASVASTTVLSHHINQVSHSYVSSMLTYRGRDPKWSSGPSENLSQQVKCRSIRKQRYVTFHEYRVLYSIIYNRRSILSTLCEFLYLWYTLIVILFNTLYNYCELADCCETPNFSDQSMNYGKQVRIGKGSIRVLTWILHLSECCLKHRFKMKVR